MTDNKGEKPKDVMLFQADIEKDTKHRELAKTNISRKLARLVYFEGLTQEQAIREALPHISPSSASKHSTRIFAQYNVLNGLYDLLPKEIPPNEFEANYNYLKRKAIEQGDTKLLYALTELSGKHLGKFKVDMNLHVSKDDEYAKRVELARKIIDEQGINIQSIDKT